MLGRRAWILLLVLALAGCGGSNSFEGQRKMPTATPTATAQAQATPEGLDVAAINSARTEFAKACKARESGEKSLTDVRKALEPLLAALKAKPDTDFRLSPNLPAANMRERIRALAIVARTHCGGGDARTLSKRLVRAATPDDS